MCPSTEPTCNFSAKWKLGLLILSALLPLLLAACASTPNQLTQMLRENEGNFLIAPPSKKARPVAKPADTREVLEVCAVVPEDNLQEMRGTMGVYFFDYSFDINLVATPQVSVNTNFSAAVPGGNVTNPPNVLNGTTAIYSDPNVSYTAGPTPGGLMSQLVVTGQDNIVSANTQFNIHLPNTATLTRTINVMPAATLTGIGAK